MPLMLLCRWRRALLILMMAHIDSYFLAQTYRKRVQSGAQMRYAAAAEVICSSDTQKIRHDPPAARVRAIKDYAVMTQFFFFFCAPQRVRYRVPSSLRKSRTRCHAQTADDGATAMFSCRFTISIISPLLPDGYHAHCREPPHQPPVLIQSPPALLMNATNIPQQ